MNEEKMNKEELIDAIATKSGLTKADSKKSLEAYVEAVREALAAGDTVQLTGFLTLSVAVRAARKGRNPQTGKEIDIPESKVVKASIGKQVKEAVNNIKSKATAKPKKK
ncbi:MAG: HU family DNA-binding protein [Alphaproteobacteria bacterium]